MITFCKRLTAFSLTLIMWGLFTSLAVADEATGKIIRGTESIVFLDTASQLAVHVTAATKMPEGTTVTSLTGQSVRVTYHTEGNRNIADSITLAK